MFRQIGFTLRQIAFVLLAGLGTAAAFTLVVCLVSLFSAEAPGMEAALGIFLMFLVIIWVVLLPAYALWRIVCAFCKKPYPPSRDFLFAVLCFMRVGGFGSHSGSGSSGRSGGSRGSSSGRTF